MLRQISPLGAVTIEIYTKFTFLGVGTLFYESYSVGVGGGVIAWIDESDFAWFFDAWHVTADSARPPSPALRAKGLMGWS